MKLGLLLDKASLNIYYNQKTTSKGVPMKWTLLVCLSLGLNMAALASAPQVKKSAPGFYRFMVGDIEVTPLLDGTFMMKPEEIFKNVKAEQMKKLLALNYEGPAVRTSVIGYLVNTGSKLVLIDTGLGANTMMGPGFNHLLENLKASGYKPEQVDEVYTTHMHGDHIGGLTAEGKANFPNAVLRSDKHDSDFWLSDEQAAKAAHPMVKSMIEIAKAMYAPYIAANKFSPFDGETELVPGVHAHPAYGHTAGHTIYTIESQGKKLWLIGDSMHIAALQFPDPSAASMYDTDSKAAVSERKKTFAAIAKAGDLIGAAHLPFPGVGHIRAIGKGYEYRPLTYAPVE